MDRRRHPRWPAGGAGKQEVWIIAEARAGAVEVRDVSAGGLRIVVDRLRAGPLAAAIAAAARHGDDVDVTRIPLDGHRSASVVWAGDPEGDHVEFGLAVGELLHKWPAALIPR